MARRRGSIGLWRRSGGVAVYSPAPLYSSAATRRSGWPARFHFRLNPVAIGLVLRRHLGDKSCMPSFANVVIHASQFPENIRRDLLKSLRTRRVNHKFLYDGVRQTQKWLALHQAYSPTRNDADCRAVYDRAFRAAAEKIKSPAVHVIGLGCGGGQKDTRLLKLLKRAGRKIFYTPGDVSAAMVLTARRTALAVVPEENCYPVVCDLATADDLVNVVGLARCADRPPQRGVPTQAARLLTFFGMIPNFEPQLILPKLAALLRPRDLLLFSANLAPGDDYAAGMEKILPQYDNALTRDWLLSFLDNLGVGRKDGELRFKIENVRATGLKRIVANFQFNRRCRIAVEDEKFDFRAGENIRLFFSYRYTSERIRPVLARHGLEVGDEWITRSGEEGVFLCRRR
jgi:L-histidine Nalpha-methyltransferase